MFLRIILKKLGFKENKFFFALIYGSMYALVSFIIFAVSGRVLGRPQYLFHAYVSVFIGIMMFLIYYIRWEIIKEFI